MKKYVADVFDVDKYTDKGINKIFLIAGVCSGKSTWVKEVLAKKGSVLFITSRKAKAESDLNNSTFSDVIKWNTAGNQTLLTNAGLAKRIENITLNTSKDVNNFINHFDYIVVDEVHSVASDSLFADSCPTLLSFIEYVADIGKPIICMTGTPEPIQAYFEQNNWCILNYLNVCNYVHPSQIILIKKHDVIDLIKRKHTNNKIIYFANRTSSIKEFCKELLNGVLEGHQISISVSKSRETEVLGDLKKALKNDEAFEKIKIASEQTYEQIINKKLLPDECKILFSTSTLKEGIDIDNENVVMFCENHVLSNLIQFFGRARKSSTTVYIIVDSSDHKNTHNELLYSYAINAEVKAANYFYKTEFENEKSPFTAIQRNQFIKHIAKNPYIYFDFLQNKFKVFDTIYHEEKRLQHNFDWKLKLFQYCSRYRIPIIYFGKDSAQDALHRLALQADKFYGEKYITTIQHLLYIAYGIDGKHPKRINELLKSKNVNMEIKAGKGTKTTDGTRGVTYWQVTFAK